MSQNKGLGKGLSALLDERKNMGEEEEKNLIKNIDILKIEPNREQPRKDFEKQALEDLAKSILQHGVIQPIALKALDSGRYKIIAGERRWRASRIAGLSEVPAYILDVDDKKARELAMVENLQREDLNAIEEAEGYKTLIEDFGITQEEAAHRVGKSRSAVANTMRLLVLPNEIKDLVSQRKISEGHARTLLAVGDKTAQLEAAERIITGEMSVRQAEAMVKNLSKNKEAKENKDPLDEQSVNIEVLEKEMTARLSRRVKIFHKKRKGTIELEYYGAEDLEELLERLKKAF